MVAATAACLVAAAPAWADHLKPVYISPTGSSASVPQVAANGAGIVVAAWRETDGETTSIRAATKAADGDWSPSERISAPVAHAEAPAVSMDQAGNAVAVWHVWSGGESAVQAAVRPAGGTWGAPEALAAPGVASFNAEVAVVNGRAIVVWAAHEGGGSVVQSAARTIGSGGWEAAQSLTPAGTLAWVPHVALAENGSAVAVWRRWNAGYVVIQAAGRPIGGTWSAPEDLSAAGADSRAPLVAMDGTGNVTAAWLRPNSASLMVQVAYKPAVGAWEPARYLSHRGFHARGVELAMNRAGDAIVTWRHEGTLFSTSRPRGAGWKNRLQIDEYCRFCQVDVALDEEGNATASWSASGSIEASFKPVGEAWQERYLISDYNDFTYRPNVVTDDETTAVAVWVDSGAKNDRIQSVSYNIRTAEVEAAADAAEEAAYDAVDKCYEEAETEADEEKCDAMYDDLIGDDGGERVEGTAENDVLIGTPGNDVFEGYGGNDRIYGRGGHDVVYGGSGNDRVFGGVGSDRLYGGPGRDRLRGGRGPDLVSGGGGRDRLLGGGGSDRLFGRDHAGDDVRGGLGLDRYRLDRKLDRRARGIERRL